MLMAETMNPITAPIARGDAPLERPRLNWGAALKTLQRLLNAKDETGQVFEIIAALDGDYATRRCRRLFSMPDSGRLAYEQIELAPRLIADAWLDSLSPGTVGIAYLDFVRSKNISTKILADISRQCDGKVETAYPHV